MAPVRIILAENHSVMRTSLSLVIAQAFPNAIIETVVNGDELIRKVREQNCDLVITEIAMPVTTGLQAIRTIRRDFPRLPVLAMSIHAGDFYISLARNAGASGFLPKNNILERLVAAINEVLAGKSHFPGL